MTTEPQWQIVIQHTQDAWVDAFAASILDVDPSVDPDRAQAAMRWAFRVPRPRDGRDEFEPTPEDAGRSRDDDEQADRAAERDWAARWGR